uniref:Tectonic domain-containing protein n=1 Tax=Echeneis naucrates TaxID=173247 RepID=A0A665UFK2_ECHNA
MTSSRWCCSIYISIALCTHFANTATESGVSTTASPGPTNAEPFSSPTPTAPPGGTEAADSTSLWTTDPSEAPTEPTEPTDGPPAATVQECVCDLTPGFCDIGCCCDTVDCGVANLTTVFTECPQKVAIKTQLGNVDDVIKTYFSSSSVRGLLRQPSPGVASALCISRNPAKFLRSVSMSCTRMLTPESCTTDPTLMADSYFSDLNLIKVSIPACINDFVLIVTGENKLKGIVFFLLDSGGRESRSVRLSGNGECSSDSSRRMPILFTYNAITGCKFRSPSSDCSELQSQIYGILQGLATPDEIAMNSGYQIDYNFSVIHYKQETCESGCTLPISLSIQVLWAHQGLLDFPQSFILGAKYLFKCKKIKVSSTNVKILISCCPVSSPLALTTSVTFADATLYPEPPRGLPQADWKFPFGFFTRGTAELDGHIIVNSSDTEKVTLSLMFTVMLLTGLEFFTM